MGGSIWALLAGFLVGVILSLGTDMLMRLFGIFPRLGQPMSDGLFALATAYRIPYSIAGSYIIARLAPNRPMFHALLGGAVGFVLSLVGAVVTWNRNLGPHWYPLLLVATAMPCAWLGGRLHLLQLRARSVPRMPTT